ncbi:hypothetical protein HCN44_006029 [Aphidius gifuensis]|uniref:UTP--glucose-1-phosphate uridylyltransferase n=1 Tax=Aphidius gifuensis TaxID=684658 RepID=A0A835CXI0_APHGI|nr:hypothetical protein HCN44_006029 [Aphidius gifuensis]
MTKRDAENELVRELGNLESTATPESRERVKSEFTDFTKLFQKFLQDQGPSVAWEQIQKLPPDSIRDYDSLQEPSHEEIRMMLNKLIVVKLNSGFGTSMGCHGPKSSIVIRNDLTFLDLTVQQIESLNKTFNVSVPLMLMNSFNTDADTERIIRKYRGLDVNIKTFNQSCHPRICRESLLPIAKNCDIDEDIDSWYPPGHGDFYESFHVVVYLMNL